MGTGAFF